MFKVGDKVINKYTFEEFVVTDKKFQFETMTLEINGSYVGYNSMYYNYYISENELRKLKIEKLKKRLTEKGYKINFDQTVIDRIFELNGQEEYGARPIKRIIQNLCEDFLSEEILKGNIIENKQITLKIKDGQLVVRK